MCRRVWPDRRIKGAGAPVPTRLTNWQGDMNEFAGFAGGLGAISPEYPLEAEAGA